MTGPGGPVFQVAPLFGFGQNLRTRTDGTIPAGRIDDVRIEADGTVSIAGSAAAESVGFAV